MGRIPGALESLVITKRVLLGLRGSLSPTTEEMHQPQQSNHRQQTIQPQQSNHSSSPAQIPPDPPRSNLGSHLDYSVAGLLFEAGYFDTTLAGPGQPRLFIVSGPYGG